jgi:hypothetical protein
MCEVNKYTFISSSFSAFHTRLCHIFPIRINLELCIFLRDCRTPWTGDQPFRYSYVSEICCSTLRWTDRAIYLNFFNSNIGGGGGIQLGPLGTSTSNCPIVPAPCEWLLGWIISWVDDWQEKPEILREKLPQCQFGHHKSHKTWPVPNPGRRVRKTATNCLSWPRHSSGG